ncbi:DNA helicase UvrD [Halostagnicola larsenii XH-48]|uniref:DNA 3'-5' helicase n=1 Tax=Halostagnicola larsenii XH-48 TaxID=797299 RepID=W0JNP0_9EURY|nr:ATP-dependent DNA helicase [Halostagnicola larsenii]AHG00316.1 DNA helicase UvrD [Halostagnicola larsenii XH-48]
MGDRSEPAGTGPLEPKGNQRRVIESESVSTAVDAGAGTGKTTTMLMRIERAIDSGAVDPEDVLVLTFANEAASSIREAVTERLDPEAAAAIDVYTYHSFCYQLVREYAYYLGLSPEFEVVTERKRRRIVGRLLAETEYDFAAAPARGDSSPADLADAIDGFIATMSQEDIGPETLESRLPSVRTLELCTEFVLWLEETATEELSFDKEAFRYFNDPDHLEAARESLIEYGKLVGFCREKIAEAPSEFRSDPVVGTIDRYLRALQTCVTNTLEELSLEEPTTKHLPRALFGNEIWGESTGRLEQTPFGRLKHYVEFLRLARHYTDVYADYRETLARDDAVDFDELVRTATGLLTGAGSVADEIANRWDHVYCDEFQDTDETQFRLIRALTEGETRPDLLAIGDKDQAIYGWRGTDREGLDRLADTDDEHESIELELNFRSRQEILDLTNHCSYGPQESKTLRENDRTPGEYDEADPPHRLLKVESDELPWSTPEQVARATARLLNGRVENVPRRSLEDIAIIVRTNRQAQAVADELESRRIPFAVSGSPRGKISPGVQTVLSYLRVLVDPDADAHLRRVLLYRYRIPESDLAALARRGDSLYEALFDIDCFPESASDLESGTKRPSSGDDQPSVEALDRLSRARDHLEALESIRDVYPLSEFVRRFRERTNLEWFLTAEERAELERIDRFVEGYDGDSVLTALTPRFVDALERTLRASESSGDRGARSSDRIDVMTVHQAKGLQFDTVLAPFLSDEEWCVDGDYARRDRYRLLEATLDDDVDSPLLANLAADPLGEEWRVLHVALTRAENHLLVFGSEYDYDGDETQLSVSTAESCLADDIEWSVAGKRMDLWSTVSESFETVREQYPKTVVDWTDALSSTARTNPGTITYYQDYDDRRIEPLETREAIETVHQLGRLLRNGQLLPAADAASSAGLVDDFDVPMARQASALTTETVRFPVETLSTISELEATMRHSYSALATHETCARKHYLDHVVQAPGDSVRPAESDRENLSPDSRRSTRDRADSRLVGSIFHAVAEEAFHRGYDTRGAWHDAASRQLAARDSLEHREAVLACIDRYFEAEAEAFDAPVADWETVAAELPFVLEDVSGVTGDVVGYVDSVQRTPAGGLVVLDYKATAERIDPGEAVQLSVYARACEQAFDEPIAGVGYVYVGDVEGSRVELLEPGELPDWSAVRESLASIDEPTFVETTPGPHCRYCPHRSLGCGPDGDASAEAEGSPSIEADGGRTGQ